MKELGRALGSFVDKDFEPHFVFESVTGDWSQHHIIDEKTINSLCSRGVFDIREVTIKTKDTRSLVAIDLVLQSSTYPGSSTGRLPISGFPRALVRDERGGQGKSRHNSQPTLANSNKYSSTPSAREYVVELRSIWKQNTNSNNRGACSRQILVSALPKHSFKIEPLTRSSCQYVWI